MARKYGGRVCWLTLGVPIYPPWPVIDPAWGSIKPAGVGTHRSRETKVGTLLMERNQAAPGSRLPYPLGTCRDSGLKGPVQWPRLPEDPRRPPEGLGAIPHSHMVVRTQDEEEALQSGRGGHAGGWT